MVVVCLLRQHVEVNNISNGILSNLCVCMCVCPPLRTGNCGKLILNWIQPIPSAIATVLNGLDAKMIIDFKQVSAHLAKYDKDFLATVDTAAQALYKKSLLAIVTRSFSGNSFKAVKGKVLSEQYCVVDLTVFEGILNIGACVVFA